MDIESIKKDLEWMKATDAEFLLDYIIEQMSLAANEALELAGVLKPIEV